MFTPTQASSSALSVPGKGQSAHPNVVQSMTAGGRVDPLATSGEWPLFAHCSRATRGGMRTAQVIPSPIEFEAVAFGHRVTFERDDGRR
jgi:hypothetical protein